MRGSFFLSVSIWDKEIRCTVIDDLDGVLGGGYVTVQQSQSRLNGGDDDTSWSWPWILDEALLSK